MTQRNRNDIPDLLRIMPVKVSVKDGKIYKNNQGSKEAYNSDDHTLQVSCNLSPFLRIKWVKLLQPTKFYVIFIRVNNWKLANSYINIIKFSFEKCITVLNKKCVYSSSQR